MNSQSLARFVVTTKTRVWFKPWTWRRPRKRDIVRRTGIKGFETWNVVVDEYVPKDTAFLINPDFVYWDEVVPLTDFDWDAVMEDRIHTKPMSREAIIKKYGPIGGPWHEETPDGD